METGPAGTYQTGFTLLIISISLATFMSALDGTIVNIALPTISSAFDISTSMVSWVSTVYLLVMAGCVLIFGKISDVIGFKKVFLSGFLIFTVGSFGCGFLPDFVHSFPTLIGSRAFQAVGGAMITAIGPAMVTAYLPMEQKGKAMAIVLTFAGLGTAIGPTIGGLLTQFLSWNWIFFINVPVGIVAILLGAKVIPAMKAHERTGEFDRNWCCPDIHRACIPPLCPFGGADTGMDRSRNNGDPGACSFHTWLFRMVRTESPRPAVGAAIVQTEEFPPDQPGDVFVVLQVCRNQLPAPLLSRIRYKDTPPQYPG